MRPTIDFSSLMSLWNGVEEGTTYEYQSIGAIDRLLRLSRKLRRVVSPKGFPPTGKKSMRSLLDMPLLVVEVMEAALTAVTHWSLF